MSKNKTLIRTTAEQEINYPLSQEDKQVEQSGPYTNTNKLMNSTYFINCCSSKVHLLVMSSATSEINELKANLFKTC